jgi:GTP-binding protein EngB required for normal cell division
MGKDSVPKSLENFLTLMWLSAQEDFIEFCCCASFKTYIICLNKEDKIHDTRSGKSLEKKVMIVELNGLYAEILIILTSMKVKHHINMTAQSFKTYTVIL